MWKSVVSACLLLVLTALLAVQGQDELNRDRPCEHPNAISLPSDKKCIVPIKTAYTWSNAAATCERAGGSLFQTPDSQLGSRPELMRCLASMTDPRYNVMWINALGVWSPHFTWTNGTSVNSVDYCSAIAPLRQDSSNITSDTLSVDYCVYTCQDRGARYTIYFNNSRTLECYCTFVLLDLYRSACPLKSVSTSRLDTYFILLKKDESLIQINTDGNVVSRTEILCATVDSTTTSTRRITSEMCFNSQHFICDLGDESKCTSLNCTTQECRVKVRTRCLLRVGLSYNWYAARAYCQTRGGDLWNLYALNDLKEVALQDSRVTKYWVGATNYDWKFDANSASLGSVPSSDYNRVRCGNMVRDSSTGLGLSWQWSDTVCDQQKAFLCQFDKNEFSTQELALAVGCPWVQISYPPDLVTTPRNIGGGSSGGVPVVTQSQGGSTGSSSGDSFPWEAVIASIVAGLVLLTCLGLTLAYCSRRQWLAGRFKKVREHLTFIPYFADVSGTDYDSHVNISSVSDHGSQVGLVKGGYHNTSGYNMSTSYGEQSGAFSTKSLDRRGKETLDRKSAEGQNYGSANTSLDERGYTATYNNTLPARPRDLMTLQAHMDIKDDAELASLRASFRNKPEVALVTDNVDMNFTVNHVVPRGNSQPNSELSRSSLERTMEEISLPAGDAGLGLNLPERVAEEARIYSAMTSGYH